MRWPLVLSAALLLLLVTASVACATTMYAGPQQWGRGQGAGSSYSSNWWDNWFSTYGSGYDKAVAFIDNRTYGWHNTIRNRDGTTRTYSPRGGVTFKAHCVAYDVGFYGSCTVS